MFVALSMDSRKQPELWLINEKLRVCPETPNCACSEYPDEAAYIKALNYSTTATEAWDRIQQVIIETGGAILTEKNGYLHATYKTTIMRYIDDVELRLDADKQLIHFRSASRVGHSDLGTNHKRVERLKAAFQNNG